MTIMRKSHTYPGERSRERACNYRGHQLVRPARGGHRHLRPGHEHRDVRAHEELPAAHRQDQQLAHVRREALRLVPYPSVCTYNGNPLFRESLILIAS